MNSVQADRKKYDMEINYFKIEIQKKKINEERGFYKINKIDKCITILRKRLYKLPVFKGTEHQLSTQTPQTKSTSLKNPP